MKEHLKNIVGFVMSWKLMFYSFLIALTLPNILLSFTEQATLLERVTNVILPFGFYYFLITLRRSIGVMVWVLLPFSLMASVQVVLWTMDGRSVIGQDMFLNFVAANSSESGELLGSMLGLIMLSGILYILPLVLAIIELTRKKHLSYRFISDNRKIAVGVFAIGLSMLGTCYATDDRYEMQKSVYPINAYVNVYEAYWRFDKIQSHHVTSSRFSYNATSSHPDNQKEIYILVLGETSRACNWQLYGYGRETNPLLSQRDDILVFNKVLTESNTTIKSVPMLLTPASAGNHDDIFNYKSLISAFKEAGFVTSFISNQTPNPYFLVDKMGREADYTYFIKDTEDKYGVLYDDMALLGWVKNELQRGDEKLLIVLHSYGSHYCYNKRYPRQFAHFTPDEPNTLDEECRASLINAYDNTIRYTDMFIDRLINLIDDENVVSAVMYVSDHGEEIFDDERKLILHSSAIPSYCQLHVPMLLWISPEYIEIYPNKLIDGLCNLDCNISSSLSVFHTTLDLAGVNTPYLKAEYSVLNPSLIDCKRLYLDDKYVAVPLKDAGLNTKDFERLRGFNLN